MAEKCPTAFEVPRSWRGITTATKITERVSRRFVDVYTGRKHVDPFAYFCYIIHTCLSLPLWLVFREIFFLYNQSWLAFLPYNLSEFGGLHCLQRLLMGISGQHWRETH